MDIKSSRAQWSQILPAGAVFVVLGGLVMYNMSQINILSQRANLLNLELASTTQALGRTTEQLSKNVTDLNKETKGLSTTLVTTQQNVAEVTTKVGGVTQSIDSISGTVGDLKKLSQVDVQWLKKYSKIYFMNENYVPAHLSNVPSTYLYNDSRQEQFVSEALPFLQNMLTQATNEGVTIYVKSGYRSFTEQKTLKSSYKIMYGAGTANAFSADQGYSEHQLGTTVDFITTGTGGNLTGFDTTASFAWLIKNAHKYGFVLSYPKENGYYVYEPWHWRYVGTKLATYLYENNLHFYNLDQREIDTYLVHMFE
jgi:LAS superfamily LD-carboxypeptidase LdcB